jgi:Rrf2 family transcriptional regulator, nitric oxide-sensitive transcriptional repressor
MGFTTQTDYGLRTLMFLATRRGRANVADVAAIFGISVHHVAKVVNLLARSGYVRSVRGIGGGIELAASPEEIRLGDVVLKFQSLHLLQCIDTSDVCAIQSFCKLKGILAEAERIQLEYLNSVTLADIVPTRRQFAELSPR